MRPVQQNYYNVASFDSRQQRPAKMAVASKVSTDVYQVQSNDNEQQSQSYPQQSQSYGQQSQSYGLPIQQSQYQSSSKKGGYTETEVNALRGKGNEERQEYDLGKDGAFSDFSILVGCFYYEIPSSWNNNAGKALTQKGFRVTFTTDEREFIKHLLSQTSFDVTWIISNSSTSLSASEQAQFKAAVLNFHRSGRGLFIYGDNDPWYVQANWILPDIVGTTLVGNTPGSRVLSYGNSKLPGEFDSENLIFSGINYLFEGITICYPAGDGKLTHLATSSDGKACISFMDSTPEHGRVLVDTGFTKLYLQWDGAGQARYVVNGTVYLVDVERRFDSKFPQSPSSITQGSPVIESNVCEIS